MTFDRRIVVSCTVFALVVSLQLAYIALHGGLANDLFFPICGGRAILDGVDPYGGACAIKDGEKEYPSNPLTAVVLALPFAPFGYLGAIVMWSSFVGILVFGILTHGQYWRLLIMASAPFWASFSLLQWAPLMTALLFLPQLMPLALAKPHLGLPVLVTYSTPRRLLACAVFGCATLLIDPYWPFKWLPQALHYDGFIPIQPLPSGPLLLGLLIFLELLDRRDWRTHFILLTALMPQRGFYDALPLGAVTTSPRELLAWSALSWAGYAAGTALHDRYAQFVVTFMFLPLVVARVVQAVAVRRNDRSSVSAVHQTRVS